MKNNHDVSRHIINAAETTAGMQFDHLHKLSPLQNKIARMTALFGRPVFTPILTALIVLWMTFNYILPFYNYRAPDPPPFHILSFCHFVRHYLPCTRRLLF